MHGNSETVCQRNRRGRAGLRHDSRKDFQSEETCREGGFSSENDLRVSLETGVKGIPGSGVAETDGLENGRDLPDGEKES